MMHVSLCLTFIAALAGVQAVNAEEIPEPGVADINPKDGTLSPEEQQNYAKLMRAYGAEGAEREGRVRQAGGFDPSANVILDKIDMSSPRAPSRFVLRNSVLDARLLGPRDINSLDAGASISFTRDRVLNKTAYVLRGGLAFYIIPSYDIEVGPTAPNAFRPAEAAAAIFVEADGTVVAENPNAGTLRTGIKGDVDWAGGVLDVLSLSAALYHQTDLDFESSGVGLQTTLRPWRAEWHINGARLTEEKSNAYWYFDTAAVADYLKIDDSGVTGLKDGSAYAWLGGWLGLVYRNEKNEDNPVYASLSAGIFKDIRGGNSVERYLAKIGRSFDKEGKTGVELTYDRGVDYKSLNKTDVVSLSYTIRY